MKTIKYVGPFYRVTSEGYTFIRHMPVTVLAVVADKLLKAHLNNEPVFVLAEEEALVAN